MALSIDDYIDAARRGAGLASDRQLCAHLNLSSATTSQWRTRRSWPTDETMVRLADLAGLDPVTALIDLNRWRAAAVQATRAAAIYERLAELVKAGAVALALLVIGAGTYPKQAVANAEHVISSANGRRRRRLIYQWLSRRPGAAISRAPRKAPAC